jgi:hypothetical protein
MTKLLLKNLLSPLSIAMTVWIVIGSFANANESTTAPKSLAATVEPTADEIEQTSQATELKSGDWAYQTLQSLGNKYSCAGTPDGKPLSREEFATSLNGCVQSIEQLVARRKVRKFKKRRYSPAPSVVTPPPAAPEVLPPPPEPTPVVPPAPVEPEVTQQDLDQLKQLVQSFSTELQAVDSRIRALDAKVTQVKDQSFSTTTKLVGEAIFAVNGLAGGPSTASRNTIFADRVRLNFRSSFTGKDLLVVRLQSRNTNSFGGAVATSASGTNMTRFGFEGSEENATYVSRLQYQLPLSATSKVYIESVGNEFNDNYYNFKPEHQAAGTGAVTRFGRFNPVYRLSNEGAGIGVDTKLSPNLGLILSYAVPKLPISGVATETVNNPSSGNGLFNGSNVMFSQLTLKPSDDVSLGLIYARTYTTNGTVLSGNTGSNFANNPFSGAPTSGNHYSVLGSVNLSKNLVLSAWGGLTQANREAAGGGSADIWNYAATLAVKDFGAKGSTLGFVVGMQPRVASNSVATRVDKDTSLHLETFYKYKVSDNLYITPGLLILTNPEHNAANPTEYLGTVRTTFVF